MSELEQYVAARVDRKKEKKSTIEKASLDIYNAGIFAEMGQLNEANLYATLATAKLLLVIAEALTERS